MSYSTELQARTAGKKCLATLPRGWELVVWQNDGWHFSLQKGIVAIYQNFFCDGETPTYSCMVSSNREYVGSGMLQWRIDEISKTPLEALERSKAAVHMYITKTRAWLDNIESELADTP